MAPERPGPEHELGTTPGQRVSVTIPAASVLSFPVSSMHLKEGDGAGNYLTVVKNEPPEEAVETTEDDDLTSLSWLQDKNLLKETASFCFTGINLRPAVGENQESPTSDYAEELGDSSSSGQSQDSSNGLLKPKLLQHMPYDPLVHVNAKPPYSFSCLIFMAIEESNQKALPVKEIYTWIVDHFPYFRTAPTGWKNSVRHNLSLNKCFRKVDKAPNLGKGSLWMVDPTYRPNLMQALQKAPYHPYTGATLERISMSSARYSSSSSTTNRKEATPVRIAARATSNQETYPFANRRLESSSMVIDDGDSLDDVDAATAMLALKHGPSVQVHRKEWLRKARMEDSSNVLDLRNPLKKVRLSKVYHDSPEEQMVPVITTSPSEDHTYSAGPGAVRRTSSPDEAFEEGSESENSNGDPSMKSTPVNTFQFISIRTHSTPGTSTSTSDAEEQRKIAEGADALLNLAGISTRRRLHSEQNSPSKPVESTPVNKTHRNSRLMKQRRRKHSTTSPASTLKVKFSQKSSDSDRYSVINGWTRHSRLDSKLGRRKR